MIVTVTIGARAAATEEARNTMGLLLANPIRRSTVLLQKTVTMIIYAFVVGFATFAGVAGGSLIGGLDMSIGNIAATCLLVAAVSGLCLRHFAMLGLNQIDAGVQDMVDTEAWVQQTGQSPLTTSLVDSQADRQWQVRFRRDLDRSGPFSAVAVAAGGLFTAVA